MAGWLGVYDYTVIITYLGLGCSVFGIYQAFNGNYPIVFLCQGLALFCDFVDGTVARTKKNRTDREKMFGVQIDSLCDVVSFGVFPAVLFYTAGMNTPVDVIIEILFCLCCVCRLAYYNVLAIFPEDKDGADFHGLPVPALTTFIPLCFLLRYLPDKSVFLWVMRAVTVIAGVLYIRNFKMNRLKPAFIVIGVLLYCVPCIIHVFSLI